MSLTIPIELIIGIGIGIDLILAYFGFNLFKMARKRMRTKRLFT